MHRFLQKLLFFVFSFVLAIPSIFAQEDGIGDYIQAVDSTEKGMTVWQVIQSGGWVMIVLCIISIVMIALVAYLMMRVQVQKLAPETFARDMIEQIKDGKDSVVYNSCQVQQNLIAEVILSGLEQKKQGLIAIKEAVEITAKREIQSLWAGISYLSDIASVAPMVGLLGTVIGMIQAFNTIAFQSAVVKPILLAGGVSKAMVTTAAGMIVAIVAMIFYSLIRYRIQLISSAVEVFSNEIIDAYGKAIEKSKDAK